MKKGFTLAEVLITLAVIGVVAALTIPTVVHKYQQSVLYTQFMKAYNTITNVLNLVEGESGAPNTWAFDESDKIQTIKNYIYPYLKTTKICEDADITSCFSSYDVEFLNGQSSFPANAIFQGEGYTAILQDGPIVSFQLYGDENGLDTMEIYFDTNGAKGPNVFGRDLQFLSYKFDSDKSKWEFESDGDFGPEFCDPSSDSEHGIGQGCPARLLKEGKMSY